MEDHLKREAYLKRRSAYNKAKWAKKTPEQKKQSYALKMKHYHSNEDYRKKVSLMAKTRRKNRTFDQIHKAREYSKNYNNEYVKKLSDKFDNTNDLKIYFRFKRRLTQKSARQRGLDFNLTVEDLIQIYNKQKVKCFYTDVPLILKIHSGTSKGYTRDNMHKFNNYLSIDRINSKKGYVTNNIRLSTIKFNTIKQDLSDEELKEMAKKILVKLGGISK